ncbi:MAG: TSUP family transporter, partial [Bryobacteraceae bacterium]
LYLSRGYVDPSIVMPVMLGVLAGSMVGARLLARLGVPLLRRAFAIVVGLIAIQMIVSGIRGTI